MTTSSTIPTHPGRGQGRILLIQSGLGHDGTFNLVRDLAPERTETVDDVFEAVGTVGLARAHEEVDTVLVPVTIPEFSAQRIVDAFQIGDARVRMVLLVPPGRQDAIDNALAEGFDDAIEIPTTTNRLRRALGLGRETETPRHPDPGSAKPARPAGFEPASRRPEIPAAGNPRVEQALAGSAEPTPEMEFDPSISVESGSNAFEAAENLGDVHLVRAVIADDGSFRSISLSMIRAHLGTSDIHLLLPDEADENDSRATARVLHDDEHIGTLVSSTVGTDDLLPWSSWLSTWMGMELRVRELEMLTETDELTTAGNRRAFERIAAETLENARRERRIVTLMVFDIDNFKTYNDRYGHDAGDEVLRQTVDLLRCTIRRGDHVFRIGGDEFVVIFSDTDGPRNEQSVPPESVEDIAHRFQAKVCELRFPQLGLDAEGSLSISAGLATFPWDGHDGTTLLRHADGLAMESKRNGKNAIRFGPGARSRCSDDGKHQEEGEDPDLLS